MQHLQPNSTLQGGKYKIEKVLGQGGFGITYLAYNNYENKYVAIKEFFLKELCGREESTHRVITHIDTTTIERFKAKFLKEARTLMSFTHRNIVRVFDCFEENNTAYYVMEYIQGSSISEILRQRGSLDERTAISYIRKVAAALQYIHGMNINHLDVKPGNILLRSQDNEIVLIDFGTAKHYDTATGGATTMTQAGYSQGYAAIEQYRRGGVSTFTPETDIYSLGATLYKMLTNQTPPEPSLIIENGLPTMPSWISQGTSSAITAAMQINKASRPHSVSEFLRILDGDEATKVMDESTVVFTQTQSREKTRTINNKQTSNTSQSSSGSSWGWVVIFLFVIVGGVVWFNTANNNQNDDSENYAIDTLEYSSNSYYEDSIAEIKALETNSRKVTFSRNGNVFTVGGVSFKMIKVNGGTFNMGSRDEHDYNARPVHSVTLSTFLIGETEVTQGLWNAVIKDTYFEHSGNNMPVDGQSWDECKKFIMGLNAITGLSFRLPTEAEWEFAARGGLRSRGYIYSGSDSPYEVAWFEGNSDRRIHPVKSKKPNELGIYDMSGNVWEWCQDYYSSYSEDPQTNPTQASEYRQGFRCLRGGNCYHNSKIIRTCERGYGFEDGNGGYGLRLVL